MQVYIIALVMESFKDLKKTSKSKVQKMLVFIHGKSLEIFNGVENLGGE
jgi:hypothetical protein